MNEIMIDIETLGTKPGYQILEIGVCIFNDSAIVESLAVKIKPDFENNRVDPRTLAWWSSQEYFKDLMLGCVNNGLTETGAKYWLMDIYMEYRPHLTWSCGNMDIVMLEHLFQDPPWEFWEIRDFRTIRSESSTMAEYKNNHSAMYDAMNQAEHLIKIRAEK